MPTDPLLQEALDASNVSALIQKIIDPLLLEYQRRYSPLVRSIAQKHITSTTYFFNTRTSHVAGGFVQDGGARPVSNSVYTQNSFSIKLMQAVGAVTGYAAEVASSFGDLRKNEITSAVQGLTWDIETAIMWGNSASTANGIQPQFDGLDTQIADFSNNANQNSIDAGGQNFSLTYLNEVIDMVEQNAAMPIQDSQWAFIMGPTANSNLASLLTNQQRFTQVEVKPGLLAATYRDIPIIKSSFIGSRRTTMSPLTVASSGTGGSLAASTTYFYTITALMPRQGESVMATAVSVATGTAVGTNSNTISFNAPLTNDGLPPLAYKVYRGSSATNTSLLGYVDGTVGLSSNGGYLFTTSIVDTGNALVPQNGTTQPATIPSAYYGQNAGHLPRTAGCEDIYLISLSADYVVRPFVRNVKALSVAPTISAPDQLPFALVTDTTLAVRAPKYVGRLRNVVVSA